MFAKTLYRCFWCDRTTRYASEVTISANGYLKCRECVAHDGQNA